MIQETITGILIGPTPDTLALQVGTLVATQTTAWVTLGLSVVTTTVVGLAKRSLTAFAAAPDLVKSIVAILFAQIATWGSTMTGVGINPDITTLETTVVGLVVAFGSMGVHALTKVLRNSRDK